MTRPRVALLLLAVALVAACAPVASPPPRGSQPPRVRCLSDPHETGTTRPLFFLFCIESP